jgi:hypothetical protein
VTCKQSNISRLQESTRCAKTNGIASMVITKKKSDYHKGIKNNTLYWDFTLEE